MNEIDIADRKEGQGEGSLKLPLVTIITVVFNGAEFIEETIQSVVNQTYENLEYIIIDGGSTDGTVDIIKKYDEKIDKWISEPDKGIYDAMNKGIGLANGEWINFMNAGDIFADAEILSNCDKLFRDKMHSFIYSDTILVDGKRQSVRKCSYKRRNLIHQSCIYRKKLHNEYGFFLVHSEITASDFIFFNLIPDEIFVKISKVISKYRIDGVSAKWSNFYQRIALDYLFGNKSRCFMVLANIAYPFYKVMKIAFLKIKRFI